MNLYLIDGSSYIYRAFHAIRGLTNSKGFPTNAIYGFTNMLLKVLRDKKPDAMAIAFDSPVPTKRHKLYEEYKAQRPETPDELVIQIPYIKKIVSFFNIATFEIPGFEADDVICTIARRLAALGIEVFIISSDKDMMQVIGNGIKIYDPLKGIIIDEKYVKDRFGVSPERLPDVMALVGDSIDNIPGVKGIGEKIAKEMLSKFSSLDNLIENADKIENERIRRLITENVENIKLSRTLATIDTNLAIEINIEDMKVKEPDWSELLKIFAQFEFKSLIKLIPSGYGLKGKYKYITIKDRDELSSLLKKK
jgi:DNA polymerase-1